MCKNCHTHIWEQQSRSMHAKSFVNPIFQAQYFKEVLPAVKGDRTVRKEARSCAACHMPLAFKRAGPRTVTRAHVDPQSSGVTCDLCHRISGYKGAEPGNGNFIAKPGDLKFGPFEHKEDWHHKYLKLQAQSEFCAICHAAVNQRGVEVKPTFTEWKSSPYAARGVSCQDCHMSAVGYQVAGKSAYESSKAATMTVGEAPERARLYSHHFPGARTQTQIENSLTLAIDTPSGRAAPGAKIAVTLSIDNRNTGHKMPTGSIELRYLWVDLYAKLGARRVDIPAESSAGPPGYDVSGAGAQDRVTLGDDFPPGKRLYRAIFLESEGQRTDSCMAAASKSFDNRLPPAAVHKETYLWQIPPDLVGEVQLVARLNYVAYPRSFSSRLDLPPSETVLVAEATHPVTIGGSAQ